MNLKKRAELVRAMDIVAHSLNDETLLDKWQTVGVADGDITKDTDDEHLSCYCDDKSFVELMYLFAKLMKDATNQQVDGTLYCDGLINIHQINSEKFYASDLLRSATGYIRVDTTYLCSSWLTQVRECDSFGNVSNDYVLYQRTYLSEKDAINGHIDVIHKFEQS